MKFFKLLSILLIIICQLKSYGQSGDLSEKEIADIKNEIIKKANKAATDLQNLDYEEIMTFYADVDDFIAFGDGYYWGDYVTIELLWKSFTAGVKENTWKFFNPKIHVFKKDVANLLVEFDHKRTDKNGEAKGGHGCISYGMQKIEGDWKAVTMHVTHNYYVYDENATFSSKWWTNLMPENRDKKE